MAVHLSPITHLETRATVHPFVAFYSLRRCFARTRILPSSHNHLVVVFSSRTLLCHRVRRSAFSYHPSPFPLRCFITLLWGVVVIRRQPSLARNTSTAVPRTSGISKEYRNKTLLPTKFLYDFKCFFMTRDGQHHGTRQAGMNHARMTLRLARPSCTNTTHLGDHSGNLIVHCASRGCQQDDAVGPGSAH